MHVMRWIAVWVFAFGVASAQAADKMVIATGVDPSFAQFYVAKEAGLFEKHGLDVDINTGPSGSAMVPFLINDQINAAYGSDFAGVVNHNVDPKVVAVADGSLLLNWESVVGKNIDNLDGLKGKHVGIAKGTGSEIFWNGVVQKYRLNPADYTIVDIEAPEMLAASPSGNPGRLGR
jgi:ABC-type nitrate/sulfonate/bicarbonate transport system substrate-binding protein